MPTSVDPGEAELGVLSRLIRSMAQLDAEQRERVLVYLCDRYIAPERRTAFKALLRETAATE